MTWNLKKFNLLHKPKVIGVSSPEMFTCKHVAIRILDMPIKLPHGEYTIPAYALKFENFINQVAAYVGGRGGARYCYLTVDQGLVKRGTGQRELGCHVDGFQGARVRRKLPEDFSFVVSDCLPTVFYTQRFRVADINLAKQNLFKEFDRQADPTREWRPAPFEIVECSAYTVHRADVATHDCVRTFLRLSYSVRKFDRLGNSVNADLRYNWKYRSRETPKGLVG